MPVRCRQFRRSPGIARRRRWWRYASQWASQLLSDAAYVFPQSARSVSPRTHMNSRVVILLALIWFPLTAYVMFRSALGAPSQTTCFCPPFPSVIVLYVLAPAQLGASPGWQSSASVLVSFWLLIGGGGALSAAGRSQQTAGALLGAGRRQTRDTVFYWARTCAGRDVLSRTVWGCQPRVGLGNHSHPRWLYAVGAGLRPDRRVSRRLVG